MNVPINQNSMSCHSWSGKASVPCAPQMDSMRTIKRKGTACTNGPDTIGLPATVMSHKPSKCNGWARNLKEAKYNDSSSQSVVTPQLLQPCEMDMMLLQQRGSGTITHSSQQCPQYAETLKGPCAQEQGMWNGDNQVGPSVYVDRPYHHSQPTEHHDYCGGGQDDEEEEYDDQEDEEEYPLWSPVRIPSQLDPEVQRNVATQELVHGKPHDRSFDLGVQPYNGHVTNPTVNRLSPVEDPIPPTLTMEGFPSRKLCATRNACGEEEQQQQLHQRQGLGNCRNQIENHSSRTEYEGEKCMSQGGREARVAATSQRSKAPVSRGNVRSSKQGEKEVARLKQNQVAGESPGLGDGKVGHRSMSRSTVRKNELQPSLSGFSDMKNNSNTRKTVVGGDKCPGSEVSVKKSKHYSSENGVKKVPKIANRQVPSQHKVIKNVPTAKGYAVPPTIARKPNNKNEAEKAETKDMITSSSGKKEIPRTDRGVGEGKVKEVMEMELEECAEGQTRAVTEVPTREIATDYPSTNTVVEPERDADGEKFDGGGKGNCESSKMCSGRRQVSKEGEKQGMLPKKCMALPPINEGAMVKGDNMLMPQHQLVYTSLHQKGNFTS